MSSCEYVRSPRASDARASSTARRSSSVSGSPTRAFAMASRTGSVGLADMIEAYCRRRARATRRALLTRKWGLVEPQTTDAQSRRESRIETRVNASASVVGSRLDVVDRDDERRLVAG